MRPLKPSSALLVALVLLVAACDSGSTASTDAPSPTVPATATTSPTATDTSRPWRCSGGEEPIPGAQDGLPVAVAETRAAILDLAATCDFDGLDGIAAEGERPFEFNSPAVFDSPGALWWTLEHGDRRAMALLINQLDVPYVAEETEHGLTYVWAPPPEEGNAPDPSRVGIAGDGEWLFFMIPGFLLLQDFQGVVDRYGITFDEALLRDGLSIALSELQLEPSLLREYPIRYAGYWIEQDSESWKVVVAFTAGDDGPRRLVEEAAAGTLVEGYIEFITVNWGQRRLRRDTTRVREAAAKWCLPGLTGTSMDLRNNRGEVHVEDVDAFLTAAGTIGLEIPDTLVVIEMHTTLAPTIPPWCEGVEPGDLAGTEWEAQTIGTWAGPDGEPVSDNVIRLAWGLRHCDWHSAQFLTVGWPPGTEASTAAETHQYLRDPDQVVPFPERLRTTLDLDTIVAIGAAFTGYRNGDMELWLAPSDEDDAAYLVYPDHVERWPRAEPAIACS